MAEKRIDPPSRPVDGDINDLIEIVNRDPKRVYRLANPNDRIAGVQHLQRLGYIVETQRKDGPRIVGGDVVSDGTHVSWMGDVLMSAPLEVEERAAAKARDVAAMRSRAIGQKGGVDGVIGPTGQAAYFVQDPSEHIERVRG